VLIVKGHAVIFELDDGKEIRPRASLGMAHDPDGEAWPKRSVLIASYKRGRGAPAEYKGPARAYLGRNYKPRQGTMELPPRALAEWTYVGRVSQIFYERPGTRAPGKYRHKFGKGDHFHRLFKGNGPMPRLYRSPALRCGTVYRLELPPGSVADDRGYVWP
jgi:hypothetical protein